MKLQLLAVVGTGIIGHGIAEVFSSSGTETILIERNEQSLREAVSRIRTSLTEFSHRGYGTFAWSVVDDDHALPHSALEQAHDGLAVTYIAGWKLNGTAGRGRLDDLAISAQGSSRADRACRGRRGIASPCGWEVARR